MNRKAWVKILTFLLTAVAALSCAESPEIVYAPEQTVLTLEEYLAQGRETWFLTGKRNTPSKLRWFPGKHLSTTNWKSLIIP